MTQCRASRGSLPAVLSGAAPPEAACVALVQRSDGETSAAAETAFVLSLLRGLTRAGRFAFSVGFFSEADKAACAQVFDWLAAAEAGEAGAGSVVSSVRAMYLG